MSLINETSNTKSWPDTNLTYWKQRWNENRIGFHHSTVYELFDDQLLRTLPPSSEKQFNILFPLCGKTLDMKAVIDAGHCTFGIEGSPIAVEAFFNENKIPYEVDKDTCQVYKGTSHPVTIFCTDFFTFDRFLPSIDRIWDRGGLVAVNQSERELYRDRLLQMMIPGRTQLYLVISWYDDPDFVGPPNCFTNDEITSLFGSACSIELLHVSDITADFNTRNAPRHICKLEERLHRIIRK